MNNQNQIGVMRPEIYSSLQDMPEEVLLKIFEHLDTVDLFRCNQLCRRFKNIIHYWKKVNLCGKIVPFRFVRLILNNGCRYLSLNNAKIEGDTGTIKSSNLEYLDCTNCFADPKVLKDVINSSQNLKKLSLVSPNKEKIKKSNWMWDIKPDMIRNISPTLQMLHLVDCGKLSLGSIQHIVKNCVNLTEMNLTLTYLSEESVKFLASNLTPKIEKLSLGQLESVKDEHVKTLVKRCNKISELSLCCTSISNESVKSIIEELKNTLEKLDLYSTEIEYSKILELKSMSVLKLLNWCPLNRPGCSESYNLKFQFPNLCINEHQMCVKIASPCQKFESSQGLWEIETKQLKLFRKNYWR